MVKHSRLMPFQEELKQGTADVDVQVEGAIHELEVLDASRDELFQFLHYFLERELPHWNVQCRQAEFAGKWAAPRSLDVDETMGDVCVIIERVRERQFRHVG